MSLFSPKKPSVAGAEKHGVFTNYIASFIIALSAAILIMLVAIASQYISKGKDNEAFNNVKELFNILLPVIGTWMGTLLAFYFSKDNFAAASQQAQDMASRISGTDQKLQALKVNEIMIKPNDGMLLTLDDEDAFKKMKLNDLLAKMDETRSERLPILKKGSLTFIFLIYRTTLERFILEFINGKISFPGKQKPPVNKDDLIVDDMYQSDSKLFKDIQNIKYCFLPINATLDKVKAAMQDNTICQDVFITQTGSRDEKVEGWITNTQVIEKAELFKKAGT